MSEPHIVVEGAEETAVALQQLKSKVVNDLQPAQQVAQLGAQGAGSRAPVRTGELASMYSVEDRYIVNPVPYALFVEVGTQSMQAQYPVQLSLDAIESQAEAIYSDWVKQQIEGVGFDATG
jgi:hypothetical protein